MYRTLDGDTSNSSMTLSKLQCSMLMMTWTSTIELVPVLIDASE
ncbi:hypothetical protein O9992_19650 [Vibrio lentus]|nr:hypothetical protein [Vibrio lentus]